MPCETEIKHYPLWQRAKEALWDGRWLQMAALVASFSKDPSRQVGCVVVDPDRRVRGMGYNGFPAGIADTEARLTHRPIKHKLVVHAEANAVATACLHGVSFRGCTLYVTAPPCSQCAGLLIQAGIIRVVWRGTLRDDWRESVEVALAMFREVGIEVNEFSE